MQPTKLEKCIALTLSGATSMLSRIKWWLNGDRIKLSCCRSWCVNCQFTEECKRDVARVKYEEDYDETRNDL